VTFTDRTRFAAPPPVVFAAALSIDAHLSSMARSGERAVAGVTSGQIGLGETVTWRARHFGIHWTMTSEVTELEVPWRFVDEQRRGPFKRFRHEHRFTPDGDGTEMTDDISFTAPAGLVGRAVEVAVLDRYLRRLIRGRNDFLRRWVDGGDSTVDR
jgi:ligand-binding SRPBCC domain-containing protein